MWDFACNHTVRGSCRDFVLTQKSEIALHLEISVIIRGKYYRGLWPLCHHFTHYCSSSSPKLRVYCGSNPWYDVTKKLMGKYKCSEHLVPEPPKNPAVVLHFTVRYFCSLINAKSFGSFLGVIQCHSYQYAKTLILHTRGLGVFPKILCMLC